MTSLLVLARDLFEHAMNPAYGVTVNDEHAARLATAIGPEDVERFAYEVGRLDVPEALTSYGWAWVLEFAVGHNVVLGRELLAELCLRWDEPALKALVIEAALRVGDAGSQGASDVEWLDGLIQRAAPTQIDLGSAPDDRQNDPDIDNLQSPQAAVDIGSAEALLTALLIVGTEPALAAAERLRTRRWPGAGQISRFLESRLSDPDPFGRAPWEALPDL